MILSMKNRVEWALFTDNGEDSENSLIEAWEIRRSVFKLLSLKCLLDIQIDFKGEQLDITAQGMHKVKSIYLVSKATGQSGIT